MKKIRKITFTDEQLKEDASHYARELERSLPDSKEFSSPFQYLPEFMDKMETLIQRETSRGKKCARRQMINKIKNFLQPWKPQTGQ